MPSRGLNIMDCLHILHCRAHCIKITLVRSTEFTAGVIRWKYMKSMTFYATPWLLIPWYVCNNNDKYYCLHTKLKSNSSQMKRTFLSLPLFLKFYTNGEIYVDHKIIICTNSTQKIWLHLHDCSRVPIPHHIFCKIRFHQPASKQTSDRVDKNNKWHQYLRQIPYFDHITGLWWEGIQFTNIFHG